MSSNNCENNHDDFCFVCGHRIFIAKRRLDQREIKRRYVDAPKFVEEFKKLFDRDPLQRIIEWSPQTVCSKCYNEITHPERRKSIVSPMEWHEPKNHPHDCYFCQTTVPPGINKRKESSIEYADVPSVKRAKLVSVETADDDDTESQMMGGDDDYDLDEAASLVRQPTSSAENVAADDDDGVMNVEQADEINIGPSTSGQASKTPFNMRSSTMSYTSVSSAVSSGDEFLVPKHLSHLKPRKETIKLNQERLNDIVRDMNLTKENAEFLASRLTDLGLGDGK